jgi:endonuclease V-like protein UPF0215 family
MRAQTADLDLTDSIAKMITGSPHRQQIRVLLLQDELLGEGTKVDILRLSERVEKPVIMIHDEESPRRDEEKSPGIEEATIKRGGRVIRVSLVGVAPRVAERVIQVATREEPTPEALRVAWIMASSVGEMSCISFKSDSKG